MFCMQKKNYIHRVEWSMIVFVLRRNDIHGAECSMIMFCLKK